MLFRSPKLKTNWRWEDEEQALLSSCSSLISIVETEDSRVVQFSHFSVKEFLTSARLAISNSDVSRYHIDLEGAHTILAQACMSVLLQPERCIEENGVGKGSPLAGYAARHWVTHAQFGRVPSFLRKAMEYLFDLDMPYFAAWLQLYDIDTRPDLWSSSLYLFAVSTKSDITPLYYAALCGFKDLVEHLVTKYPKHVNISGGYYVTPLVAALVGKHFQTVELLRHNGAHVNVRGNDGVTPLFSAAWYGDLVMVQLLLDYNSDVNARDNDDWTPIHYVPESIRLSATSHNNPQVVSDVTRLLLEHGADANAQTNRSSTPLHLSANRGRVDIVRVLLEHGANVCAEDDEGRTPLHEAANNRKVEVVSLLLEHGAHVHAKDDEGRTPLHVAAGNGRVEVVRLLLEHGAHVHAEDNEGRTPLHVGADDEGVEVVRVLLEHGTNVVAEDDEPYLIASAKGDASTDDLPFCNIM